MSHSVLITLIADQEIEICGEPVNVHDIEVVRLDSSGNITSVVKKHETQQAVQADAKTVWSCDCGYKHIDAYEGFTCICGAVFRTA